MTDETVPPPKLRGHSPALAVALVGFMGAGKTSVGRALAQRMGWRFEDLDDRIQKREGRSIEQIFEQTGESGFRTLESAVLQEILTWQASEPLVLALGGGAFVREEMQDLLRRAGIPAVFLDAPVEELFRRCDQPGLVRPLRRNPVQFRELYEQRRPAYMKAFLRIETSGKTVTEVAEEIISELRLVPDSGVTN
ncbi:MAG TPA: shikimate kinase [Terriglobales bacterium]|nr:shikimate kinase [Terriglobales bacterium]